MAWKYMNYDTNEFSSVWTKVVLPTIKIEMNLQRSGYAVAIKNGVIRGKLYILSEVHLLAIDYPASCLLAPFYMDSVGDKHKQIPGCRWLFHLYLE